MPYALAARWIIYTGAGVPAHEAARHLPHFEDTLAHTLYTSFEQLHALTGGASVGKLGNRDLAKPGRPPAAAAAEGFLPSEEAVPDKIHRVSKDTLPASKTYSEPGIVANAAHTVFIVDEAHQLLQPYEQRYGDETTRREGIALSEALWRNSENVYTTPYLFCGTATPNPTTDPSLTACMYQLINGKLRATSFFPFLVTPEGERPITTLREYRELLAPGHGPPRFRWRLPEERTPQYLVVNPRTFLEPSSEFVHEMTLDPQRSQQTFPLRVPAYHGHSRLVAGWAAPPAAGLGRLTYAEAAHKVRACLPDAPPATQSAEAYLRHDVLARHAAGLESLQNGLAHSNFVCAVRREDALLQAQRIYKPIYSDLNRLFLQDMVYNRVFTANSYPDYRYFPAPAPDGAYNDPLTRCVEPHEALSAAPDTPRARLARAYPTAVVFDAAGAAHVQDPWALPADAAARYAENLQQPLHDEVGRACRWNERSLWARCDAGFRSLAERLVEAYLRAPHAVDLELEDELRRQAAYNSPKLVAAADDLYGGGPEAAADPWALLRGKSFFYLNVKDRRYPVGEPPEGAAAPAPSGARGRKAARPPKKRKAKKRRADAPLAGLDDNVFIVVASFYLRMRCRPFLQHLLGRTAFEAHATQTVQHALGWLEALRGQGLPPPAAGGEAWAQHWVAWRAGFRRQRAALLPGAAAGLYVPAFYALADAKMSDDEQQAVYERYRRYLGTQAGGKSTAEADLAFDDVLALLGMPELRKAMVDAQNEDDPCVGVPLNATPAGQSAIFAADNAYKAVDLKCDGFNLCFGPLPRGKQIQQTGRNRRGCEFEQLAELATKPLNWRVYLRQMFLVPRTLGGVPSPQTKALEELLLQDCLLDSFYAEQNEVNDWLRAVAVSASVGCSLWWAYSKWAELLASYHDHVEPRGAMDWFFNNAAGNACEDAAPPRIQRPPPADAAAAWLEAHGAEEAAQTGLFRCSRHSTTELGSIVPSLVGALEPASIVRPPGPGPPEVDATCAQGTAHGYCAPRPPARSPQAPRPYDLAALFKTAPR